MGNISNKETSVKSNGEAEAHDSKSRLINVIGPDESIRPRNIFEHETVYEFLESCFGSPHVNYQVVLCFPLNRELMLQNESEFSEYWDEIEYIKIVPFGYVVKQGDGTSDLRSALKFK